VANPGSQERSRLQHRAFGRNATADDFKALADYEATIELGAERPLVDPEPRSVKPMEQLAQPEPVALTPSRPRKAKTVVRAVALAGAAVLAISIGWTAHWNTVALTPNPSLSVFSRPQTEADSTVIFQSNKASTELAGFFVITESRRLNDLDGNEFFAGLGAVNHAQPGEAAVFVSVICLAAYNPSAGNAGGESCGPLDQFLTQGILMDIGGSRYQWGPSGDVTTAG
jgi:hypothetical protein